MRYDGSDYTAVFVRASIACWGCSFVEDYCLHLLWMSWRIDVMELHSRGAWSMVLLICAIRRYEVCCSILEVLCLYVCVYADKDAQPMSRRSQARQVRARTTCTIVMHDLEDLRRGRRQLNI